MHECRVKIGPDLRSEDMLHQAECSTCNWKGPERRVSRLGNPKDSPAHEDGRQHHREAGRNL